MTKQKSYQLSQAHQIIWDKLRSLPDGERIIGSDLRELASIVEIRSFYQIIEDLRNSAIFIGANRNDPKGYYEIRTDREMDHFLSMKRKELQGEWEKLNQMELAWIQQEINKKGSVE